MGKLNEIIAVEKGVKALANSSITETYKKAQKVELFNGFSKVYEKINEDSENLPPESKKVMFSVKEIIEEYSKSVLDLGTVVARKDWTNSVAVADIVLDHVETGKESVVAEKVPVTHLLFLEKTLTDMRTFINSLPLLDVSEDWRKDDKSDLYRTEPQSTHRQKKVQKPIMLAPATEQHPAQVQLISEDILVGYWKNTKLSGAISKPEKDKLVNNVEAMLRAVKKAREVANSIEEKTAPNVMNNILGYVFG